MPFQNPPNPPVTPGDALQCTLCEGRAWRGPGCPGCPLYQKQHYAEGIGSEEADFFCIAESPHIANVSSNTLLHQAWNNDIEKVIRQAFVNHKAKRNNLRNLEGRYTYAIRCMHERPVRKMLKACRQFFFNDLDQNHKKNVEPIMIFAMGPAVLQAFDIKVGKYSDVQGQFIEAKARGKKVIIFPSLSKRQLIAKTGFYDILLRHIEIFMDAVDRRNRGLTIATKVPLEELTKDYIYPKTVDEVRKLVEMIVEYADTGKDPNNHVISIDTETNTLYPHRSKLKVLSLVVAWDTGKAASIPLEHPETPWTLEEVYPYISQLLNCQKPKVFHNAKFDLKVLARKGWHVRRFLWDTLLGEHLLSEDKKGFYGLKPLTKLVLPQYAGYEDQLHEALKKEESDNLIQQIKTEEEKRTKKKEKKEEKSKLSKAERTLAKDTGFIGIALDKLNLYGAVDADVTRQLYLSQRQRMDQEEQDLAYKRKKIGTNRYFKELVRPMTNSITPLKNLMISRSVPVSRVLADMELNGVPIDREYIEDLAIEMDRSILHSKVDLHAMILPNSVPKGVFNPNSAPQLRKILYSTGFKHPETGELVCYKGVIKPPETKTGLISTNAQFLRSLKTQHDCPFSKVLLEYRATMKARGTFVENIRVLSREDGRMHTTFHINGTSTGRLCVSEDTILDTDKGSFVISQLDLTKIQNVSILTHANRLRRINAVFYKGRERMYRVKLKNGDEIEVTANHRFFTPQGVKRLRELKPGDEVTTFRNHSHTLLRGDRYLRRGFYSPLPRRKTNGSRVQEFGCQYQDSAQFGSSIQGKICRADSNAETPHLLHGVKGEYPREKSHAKHSSPEKETTGTRVCRVQHTRNRQTPKNNFMVCAAKSPVTFFGESTLSRNLTVQDVRFRFGIFGTARTIFPWNRASCSHILRQSSSVLPKTVRRSCPTNRTSVVCKRTGKKPWETTRKENNSEGSSLLEFKPARNAFILRVTRGRYSSYPASSYLQKLYGRLWVSSYETSSRSRRTIPWERGHQKTGSPETSGGLASGVSSIALHDKTGGNRPEGGRVEHSFGIGRIESITPIGIRAVWDIEVEEDHSYVAHGFVNHNSSSGENMQNLPLAIGSHNIKKIFVPSDRENMVIVNTDAKAAEVRLYAAYSGDAALIKALQDGMDPHSFFSGMVYRPETILAGVPKASHAEMLSLIGIDDQHAWSYADFESIGRLIGTKDNPGPDPTYGKRLEKLRKNMKRVVFGILYGASRHKISDIVGIPPDQAQAIIDVLFRMFPTIPEYIKRTQQQLQFMGMVETFTGRRRRLNPDGLPPKLAAKAQRQAVNFKIQSNSSDIVLDVLCDVDGPVREMGGRLLITVHDSIVFELPKKYVHQMPDFIEEYGVKRTAQKYPWLPVPFKWDVTVGPSYGEQISIRDFLSEYKVTEIAFNKDDYIEHEIKQDFEELAS